MMILFGRLFTIVTGDDGGRAPQAVQPAMVGCVMVACAGLAVAVVTRPPSATPAPSPAAPPSSVRRSSRRFADAMSCLLRGWGTRTADSVTKPDLWQEKFP